ncbi:MAG: lipopolysaccharide assembly protein LapA domain-containing protein [Actinomycetota bacterium]|nr:lipopolysaccharide assembly protein LapA domain-containing protein [Actinomycetota bacterium]
MTESIPPTADNPARRRANGPTANDPGAPVDREPGAPAGADRAGISGAGIERGAASAVKPSGPPVAATSPVTRTAAVWVAVAVGLTVLVLLIIFILQNQDQVLVRFLGMQGSLALGVALLIAAVGGGILVALAGGARIIQLRIHDRRRRKRVRS